MSDESAPGGSDLGARLRALRARHGLSARQVAEAAAVSPAYLSRLEHGKVSPTVDTLTRVVQAMGESVASLFVDDSGGGPVVRRSARRTVHHRGVADEILTPPHATRLEVLETVIEPGAGSGPDDYHHPGDEECVVVLDGALVMWLDGERHDLATGDAITFACRTPHRWANPAARPARVLWVITPASY
ncbi:cupin domain-containing protein [Pseudonocardia zijingensis]|jgi:transcriptional regulator with XRE-family HTH domain|uniref:Cupin domain-containing protein n=1 Tax=Pseudonocardia zijingensis TaxID=153376 RepID=A0ABP3YP80_9PSEU